MSRINMFDYRVQYLALKKELKAAIDRVLSSGQLILGPEVRRFEEAFSDFLGGGGDGVGVNSGTDALVVAMMALGIGPDEEVITVANTAVPTVSAIRSVGATPVFCDVDPNTCLMDLNKLSGLITQRTRAVVPVHLFGNVVDVPRIREIIGDRNISIVEDCAQAHGSMLKGQIAGTMGDVGAFSFYPTKNLGAYGDAGLCYSASSVLVKEMRRIRTYGFEDRYYAQREGINSRMDEVQAAILRVKLKYLSGNVERRRGIADGYKSNLCENVAPIIPGAGVFHSYHLFVIKVKDRDRVRMVLDGDGVETGIHYPYPIHLMKGYDFLAYKKGSLPNTEALAKIILSLPLYPELPEASVNRVCDSINHLFAS